MKPVCRNNGIKLKIKKKNDRFVFLKYLVEMVNLQYYLDILVLMYYFTEHLKH